MKTISKIILSVVGMVSFASVALAGPSKTVPEALSPLWLAVPLAGMMAYNFIRPKKR